MLLGKAALVTGSTSGLGLSVVKALAGAGCSVAMHGFGDPAEINRMRETIAGENGVKVMYSDADVRKPAACREMVQSAASQFGRLDILVNNAGIQFVSPVKDFPEDKWDDILAVCLNATFHATKAALPHMMENGWGRVVNTGSMHSLVASPYKSAYNAAKHGVAGFTKTLALEVATQNITVNAICPGYMLTPLVRNQLEATAKIRGMSVDKVVSDVLLVDQPTKKFVETEDVAAFILFLCGPHSSSFNGACLSMDGGWVAR